MIPSELSVPGLSVRGGVPVFTYPLFQQYNEEVTNIVSTRMGGVSKAPYDTLNLSLSSADERSSVLENRQRLALAVGIDLTRLSIAQLIQGTHIATITPELLKRSPEERMKALEGTDGLLTNIPDAPLAVLVADCTAISFYDPFQRVVALAHAGWRGTSGNIAAKMVEEMKSAFGCQPANLIVGLSPNMSGDTFQVRSDVLDIFRANFGGVIDQFFRCQPDTSYRLDLNELLLWQLKNSGVREENIALSGFDTYARTDLFFSHRAEKGRTGRFCGLIALR